MLAFHLEARRDHPFENTLRCLVLMLYLIERLEPLQTLLLTNIGAGDSELSFAHASIDIDFVDVHPHTAVLRNCKGRVDLRRRNVSENWHYKAVWRQKMHTFQTR